MSEIYLRVVAWNIWEGNELQEVKMALYRGGLWDVVLLNEVRYVDEIIGLDVDQTKEIAETLSLPYYQYAETATTGFRGTKGVAILSRHPIIRSQRHFVVYEGTATTFATLQSRFGLASNRSRCSQPGSSQCFLPTIRSMTPLARLRIKPAISRP